jgi:hypothetical protein
MLELNYACYTDWSNAQFLVHDVLEPLDIDMLRKITAVEQSGA